MKRIPLTKNKVALVDDSDYQELSKWKWYANKSYNTFYAARSSVCDSITKKRTMVKMHAQILGIKGIDHINGNGIDNRRCNLRPATKSQNQWNSRKRKNTTSQFKGVHLLTLNNGKYKYWHARITKDQKLICLGTFKSETDAALAYNAKAKELFGEYARLNEARK